MCTKWLKFCFGDWNSISVFDDCNFIANNDFYVEKGEFRFNAL